MGVEPQTYALRVRRSSVAPCAPVHPCTSASTRRSSRPTVGLHLRPRRRPRQRSTELTGRRPYGVPDAGRDDHPRCLGHPRNASVCVVLMFEGPVLPARTPTGFPETREENMSPPPDVGGPCTAQRGGLRLARPSSCPSARSSLLGQPSPWAAALARASQGDVEAGREGSWFEQMESGHHVRCRCSGRRSGEAASIGAHAAPPRWSASGGANVAVWERRWRGRV